MIKVKEPSFCVRIAGVTVCVASPSAYLRNFCKQYITDGQPDQTFALTEEDIKRERTQTHRKKNGAHGDRQLEKTALCRKLATLLLKEHDTLLIHGSCIAVDGVAYLFTAPSHTGKSTHTKLWREMLGDHAVMVNDDKPFVRVTEEGATAYGSPWRGSHNLGKNIAVPLRAICVMSKGSTNNIAPITAVEAFPYLLGQTFRPATAEGMERTLALVQRLCGQVAFYFLSCNKEPSAARIAYEAMSKVCKRLGGEEV